MNKRQSLISSFAVPTKNKRMDSITSSDNLTEEVEISNDQDITYDKPSTSTENVIKNISGASTAEEIVELDTNISEQPIRFGTRLDIGNFIDSKKIDDIKKKMLLTQHWAPPNNYSFPYSKRKVSEKEVKHFVSSKHLELYQEWIVLSDVKKGLFCKYCVLFTIRHEAGYQKNVSLKSLVTVPLTNFKNLIGSKGDLEKHMNCLYHKDAVAAGKLFLKSQENPKLEIRNQLNTNIFQQKQENRERLIPIIKTIIFIGRHNLPFRGHRDDGSLFDSENSNSEGVFRSLLRFRVDAGDTILESHLKRSSSSASYISKTTQNQLIECCRQVLLDKILHNISENRYYSIIFDETTDVSGKSQISLILRYFDAKDNIVKEDFLGFVDAFDEACNEKYDDSEVSINASTLASIILNLMKKMGLDLQNCVGIGTDGCPLMVAEKGTVKKIQEEATNAKRTPCYSHKLNNSLSKSIKVPLIQKVTSLLKETTKFFKNQHPKRNNVLMKFLGSKLSILCETRWVERHDTVLQFASNIKYILEALEKISHWKDRDTSTKATILINSLSSFDFICGLYILSDILALTQPMSVILQKKDLDLCKGSDIIKTLLMSLHYKRSEAEETFKFIFNKAKIICDDLDISVEKTKFERNHPIQDCEEYFRIVGYIPLLESISEDVKSRFTEDCLNVFSIPKLLPKNIAKLSYTELKVIISQVLEDFGGLHQLKKEVQLAKLESEIIHWQLKWKVSAEVPDESIDALSHCDEDIYPTLRNIFKIFVSLPVSNSTAERSFSTLRRIKTWLRSTMSEERLSALAMMNIHHKEEISTDAVLNKFSSMGNHKINILTVFLLL